MGSNDNLIPLEGLEKKRKNRATAEKRVEEEKQEYTPDTIPEPLYWSDIDARRFLKNEPPARQWIFDQLLPSGIVAALVSPGGLGKSYLLMQLAFSLATGHSFGIFKPVRPTKVLYLAGEDPEQELHRRAWAIAQNLNSSVDDNALDRLGFFSTAGKIGPFLNLIGSNPALTANFDWLCNTLAQCQGVEVLVLDPLSRFYGLEENNNSFATHWIQTLEKLIHRFDLTVIYAHHESKSVSSGNDLRMSTGRGASGFRDGVRWSAALRPMTQKDAERFGILDVRNYLEFDLPKANYSPYLPSSVFFRRGPEGVLSPVNPKQDRLKEMFDIFVKLLSESKENFSRWELVKGKQGDRIYKDMKESFPGFKRQQDVQAILDYGLENGLLIADKLQQHTGKPKEILKIRYGLT